MLVAALQQKCAYHALMAADTCSSLLVWSLVKANSAQLLQPYAKQVGF